MRQQQLARQPGPSQLVILPSAGKIADVVKPCGRLDNKSLLAVQVIMRGYFLPAFLN
jgi:hypothetical protein